MFVNSFVRDSKHSSFDINRSSTADIVDAGGWCKLVSFIDAGQKNRAVCFVLCSLSGRGYVIHV